MKPWVLFDWGGTLMSEQGPLDLPMALWPEVEAMPGAQETLAQLAARYRLGIATNASVSRRNMIEIALGRVGLRDAVSEIFCYTEIGARKDEDSFWRAVLERLQVEPAEVVMIGDSLEQDVLAPQRFGIHAIWFNPAGEPGLPGVDAPVIARLADAVPLVDRWFGR